MDRNLACVEVKPCTGEFDEFRADLKKLTWFCHRARYHRGVFLVYGAEAGETGEHDLLKAKLRRAFKITVRSTSRGFPFSRIPLWDRGPKE